MSKLKATPKNFAEALEVLNGKHSIRLRFSHLFQGTNKDNMKDMLLKERGKKGKHYGK
ncbi:MAG: hypothetical protein ABSD89_12280 [Halobacteriota archaeon]